MKGMGIGLVKGLMNFLHYLWHLPLIMLQLEFHASQKGDIPLKELNLKNTRVMRSFVITKRVILFSFRRIFLIINAEALTCYRGIHGTKTQLIHTIGVENPCWFRHYRHSLFYPFLEAEQNHPCPWVFF